MDHRSIIPSNIAELVWRDVKLIKRGREYIGLCPFHAEKTPSFSVVPDKGFFHCFGCGAHGDAIDYAQRRYGLDFAHAVEMLTGGRLKVDRAAARTQPPPQDRRRDAFGADTPGDNADRIELARGLWRAAGAATGTLAETYLRHRGISIEPPPSLRFAPMLRHVPSASAWPAMIAGVQAPNGMLRGVHRTYLAADGCGKARVAPNKMMLGAIGGGAVRLDRAGPELAIGEGIETSLAFQQVTAIATWAALSTGGVRSIVLPPLPLAAHVYVIVDNDAPGESAGAMLARRAAREGRQVTLARAATGKDIDDALRAARCELA